MHRPCCLSSGVKESQVSAITVLVVLHARSISLTALPALMVAAAEP